MQLAVDCVFTSSVDQQSVANGRLVVKGIMEEDAQADAEFAIRTLAQMSELEIAALIALNAASSLSPAVRNYGDALHGIVGEDLMRSVVSTLDGKGQVEKDPPGFPGFMMTNFGVQVAAALAEDPETDG